MKNDRDDALASKAPATETTAFSPSPAGAVVLPKHETRTMLLSSLMPAPWNPRAISEVSLARLRASLTKFGVVQDIVWNKRSGQIVGGHQRVKALIALGQTDVDVKIVDLDEVDEKALNITLNNPNVGGEFTAALEPLIVELASTVGFEDLGLAALQPPVFTPIDGAAVSNMEGKALTRCPNCGHEFTP